jgi:hypothetical protein
VRPSRFHAFVAVLAVIAIVFATLIGLGLYFGAASSSLTFPQGFAQLVPGPAANATVLPSNLVGVDLRADYSIDGAQGSAVTNANVHFVRWPGGALSDRFDPLADGGSGLIYGMGGAVTPPATTMAQFASWCRSTGCAAIITLPGEIDEPSFAAQEVNEFVHNLSFSPAYWEIGNEPGLWTHFQVPWADWSTTLQTNPPTPQAYALEVNQYVAAIRSVDASTPILGLPGVGIGGGDESQWIQATVQTNGPNISGIAIHVYPVSPTQANGSLTEFYGSLTSAAGLTARIASDEATIAATCPTCHIPILVDEISVEAMPGTTLDSGFPWTPYEAAEIVQGIDANVTAELFWVVQGSYPATWLSGSGAIQPIYSLFSSLFSSLPPYHQAMEIRSGVQGIYGALLGPDASTPSFLAVVNTNGTWAVNVNLSSAIPVGEPGTLWTWSNSSGNPQSHGGSGGVPANWVLPPASLLVWHATGSPTVLHRSTVVSTDPPAGDRPAKSLDGLPSIALGPKNTGMVTGPVALARNAVTRFR